MKTIIKNDKKYIELKTTHLLSIEDIIYCVAYHLVEYPEATITSKTDILDMTRQSLRKAGEFTQYDVGIGEKEYYLKAERLVKKFFTELN